MQAGWVARLALPEDWGLPTFAALVLAEIAVPVWAENAAMTTWHPHHIAERYGLFTLIVLGETMTAATAAVRTALDGETALGDILTLVIGGVLTVFALWWLYFAQNAPESSPASGRRSSGDTATTPSSPRPPRSAPGWR